MLFSYGTQLTVIHRLFRHKTTSVGVLFGRIVLESMGYRYKTAAMSIRFERIPECDGRTDGRTHAQTDRDAIAIQRLALLRAVKSLPC